MVNESRRYEEKRKSGKDPPDTLGLSRKADKENIRRIKGNLVVIK
jgi:hypothetical protein